MIRVLSIAGSDSSGGAGIQGDIKTITAHGAHALTAITAITAQNTREITSVVCVPNLGEQLEAIANDIVIDSIKIGMLGSLDNVKAVVEFLKNMKQENNQIPIVLDPVFIATTGMNLIDEEAIREVESKLLSMVTIVTPNVSEAEYLSGVKINDITTAKQVCQIINHKFDCEVLLKGGHLSLNKDQSIDIYYNGVEFRTYKSLRIKAKHTHGTGCCLSSSIACQLGLNRPMADAIALGKTFVTLAIKYGYELGKGEGPVNPLIHFITNFVTMNDVASTCIASGGRPMMAEALEEMEQVTSKSNGLVINLGTMNASRREVMFAALGAVNTDKQKVLLDPVGCGTSSYRLNVALDILRTGLINVLKVNVSEGLAIKESGIQLCDSFGVDSEVIEIQAQEELACDLVKLLEPSNPGIVIVVTGENDVVATKDHSESFQGGTYMQQKITGTGCMLNAVIMTYVSEMSNTYKGVVKAIKHMNQASERATIRLKDKAYLMIYKDLLIDEISVASKKLYLITDEKLDFKEELLPKTEEALKSGVHILQYRVKNKTYKEQLHEASKLRELTNKYGVTFIINDHIDLAKQVKADGVHLGNTDDSLDEARLKLGDKAIVGATAKTVEQAVNALRLGANYIGVGAINPSPTKPEAIPVSVQLLKQISEQVTIPVYGIGGIRSHNLTSEQVDAIDGVAVVSAVYSGGEAEIHAIRKMLKTL